MKIGLKIVLGLGVALAILSAVADPHSKLLIWKHGRSCGRGCLRGDSGTHRVADARLGKL
jgi:hypothetical protein